MTKEEDDKEIMEEFDQKSTANDVNNTFFKVKKNTYDKEYRDAMGIAEDMMVFVQPLELDLEKIRNFIKENLTI